MKSWRQKYDEMSKTPPEPETVLRAQNDKNGSKQNAIVHVVLHQGEEPFLFCRAFVKAVVGEDPEWVLAHDKRRVGMKVIIMTNSRDRLIKKYGLGSDFMVVGALRVKRHSDSGESLIAEVAEMEV